MQRRDNYAWRYLTNSRGSPVAFALDRVQQDFGGVHVLSELNGHNLSKIRHDSLSSTTEWEQMLSQDLGAVSRPCAGAAQRLSKATELTTAKPITRSITRVSDTLSKVCIPNSLQTVAVF